MEGIMLDLLLLTTKFQVTQDFLLLRVELLVTSHCYILEDIHLVMSVSIDWKRSLLFPIPVLFLLA